MGEGRSIWRSPVVHKGLVDGLLSNTTLVSNMHNRTDKEIVNAEEDSCEAVKAALLISGPDKQ